MTKTLLIADDSPGKIAMLHMLLKRAKWDGSILIAHTTEEAMKLIAAHPDIGFGLIDYYMPSENGVAVMRALKEKNPNAHIALVSSSDRRDNQDEARAAGAEACVCTTYRSEDVERTVMALLEGWSEKV